MGSTVAKTILNTLSSLILIFNISSVAAAEYWSLGSFKNKANADRERDRIEAETGWPVIMAQSGELFRIVLPKESDAKAHKANVQALGFSPWTVTIDEVMNDLAEAETAEDNDADYDADYVSTPLGGAIDEVAEEIVEPEYTLSPPQASETYLQYCLNRANKMEREVYCQNAAFTRIAAAQVKAAQQEEGQNILYCALLAKGNDRQTKCGNEWSLL